MIHGKQQCNCGPNWGQLAEHNAKVADRLEEKLLRIKECQYDMHSEVGIKFQDLLADWACGKVGAFEVWDFVKDNITKENK